MENPARLTLGEEGYKKLLEKRERLHVCIKCKYFEHDGDTQDVCFPPTPEDCLLNPGDGR